MSRPASSGSESFDDTDPGRPRRLLVLDQAIIVRVCADPKSEESILYLHGQRSVVQADTSRTESSNFLKVERRMIWIFAQQLEVLVRQVPDCLGQ